MLEMMQTGGIFMWPIFIMLIFAFAVMLEKFFYFIFIEIDSTNNFKIQLAKHINENNFSQMKNLCQNHKNSISKVILLILANYDESKNSKSELEYIAEESVYAQIANLEKRNWVLSLSATACPQIGLLGTISGMIKAFGALSISSDAPMVASGISEALYTTAFGLIVAIPCLVVHVIVNKKIDSILHDLNRLMSLFARANKRYCCEIYKS